MVDDAEMAPILAEIRDLALAARVPVRPVSRERLLREARTEAPQGVLAQADPLPEAAFEDLARVRRGAAPPFLVALDGVTDPHNLGALLRSAECAGVTGVILPRHRAAHVTPAVTKADIENSETFNVDAGLLKPEEKLKSVDGLFTDEFVK